MSPSRAKSLAAVLLLLNLSLLTAWAADLQRGLDAYQRGDYATALSQFEPLAEQGDPVAQFSLGVMYDNGEGVIQDYEKAFQWFRRAAEQGHARAQGHLGRMYFLGRGVEEDLVQAYVWFNLAVAQGDDRFGLSQKSRKLAEEKMTDAELKRAQEQSWDYIARYVEPFRTGSTRPSPAPSEPAATPEPPTTPEPPATVESITAMATTPDPQATPVQDPTSTQMPAGEDSTAQTDSNVPLAIPSRQTPDSVATPEPIVIPTTVVRGVPEQTADSMDTSGETVDVPADEVVTVPVAPAPDSVEPPTVQSSLNRPRAPQTPPQPSTATLSLPTSPFPQTETPTPTVPASDDDNTGPRDTASNGDTGETVSEVARARPPEPTPAPRRVRIQRPVQPSPSGRFRVQLASFNSGEKAGAEGERLQRRHPELLGNLELTVQSAELERGVFHRIQAGPLTYSQANSLCGALKRQNQPCLVVNR